VAGWLADQMAIAIPTPHLPAERAARIQAVHLREAAAIVSESLELMFVPGGGILAHWPGDSLR